MNFVNLTPHVVNNALTGEAFPPSGQVARVSSTKTDQEAIGAQIYMTARLCLNRLHLVEDEDLFEADRRAVLCRDELQELPGTDYAISLLNRRNWDGARRVLRELIRDFSPRPI